jgi:hypothetical protein
MVCGRAIEAGEGIKAPRTQKGYGYVCPYCAEDDSYSSENTNRVGTQKSTALASITLGIEFETNFASEAFSNWIQCLAWTRTEDGSVYREFKSPIMTGLSSISKVFDAFDDSLKRHEINLDDYFDGYDTCGTHLNVGYSQDLCRAMRCNEYEILNGTLNYFQNLDTDIIERMFGRDFTGYAEKIDIENWNDYSYDIHEHWLNLQHGNRLEIRLCKYVNKVQYIKLMKFWRKWVMIAEEGIQNCPKKVNYKLQKYCRNYIEKRFYCRDRIISHI